MRYKSDLNQGLYLALMAGLGTFSGAQVGLVASSTIVLAYSAIRGAEVIRDSTVTIHYHPVRALSTFVGGAAAFGLGTVLRHAPQLIESGRSLIDRL